MCDSDFKKIIRMAGCKINEKQLNQLIYEKQLGDSIDNKGEAVG